MLLAHPVVLGNLVDQYETPRVPRAQDNSPEPRRRMDDPACSLCLPTGTKDVDAALVAAGHRPPGTGARGDTLLAA
ncbi:DUF5133 domain-containing protein [Streptomyces sp. NPDC018019]|uniref:DUF5133 domain-containing protein n=1 Tax=Streptomyces sp. NPDC018019 TaxID=3365030 RepID=UPI00378E7638